MALARRSGRRFEANIWPGFVDAMTALLLVLVFVLSIFMIVQFMLRETITTQDNELDQLSVQVQSLAEALGLEQRRGFNLEEEVGRLDGALQEQLVQAEAQAALIASLTTETEAQSGRIASFEEQVASLLSERTDLQTRVAGLSSELDETEAARDAASAEVTSLTARIEDIEAGLAREISAKEAAQIALAQAREEIDEGVEAARLAAARRDALQALIADLRTRNSEQSDEIAATTSQLETTTGQLETTTGELAATVEKLSEAEAALLVDAAAAEALRERLQNADAELTAMTLRLEEERAAAEETLTLLAAANAVSEDLDAKLLLALAAGQAAKTAASATQSTLEGQIAELLAQAEGSQEEQAALEQRIDQMLQGAEATAAEKAALEKDLLSQLAASRGETASSQANAEELRGELASALAAERAAREDAGTALSEADARAALLATANSALASEEALSAESQRKVEVLNQQVATLRKQVGGLQELLNEAEARDVEADVQITALGTQLNTALARVVAEERKRAALEAAERLRLEEEAKELKNYRSEFFGRLRVLLGEQEGVRIVGDRFVFSSEVLFQPASADLSALGRSEIAKIAALLRTIASDIPSELDWVIRVDGHTDNLPLSGFGVYADNWELSQARALSVVRFMTETQGIPPQRLAANGFGEFQPINRADTPEARAQNRRIELKLTER